MLPYDPLSKRLGGYLIDAGLIQPPQIEVALHDQQSTGMRLGDILVERGWLSRKTIEYIISKVIEPEQITGQPLTKDLMQEQFRLLQIRAKR